MVNVAYSLEPVVKFVWENRPTLHEIHDHADILKNECDHISMRTVMMVYDKITKLFILLFCNCYFIVTG